MMDESNEVMSNILQWDRYTLLNLFLQLPEELGIGPEIVNKLDEQLSDNKTSKERKRKTKEPDHKQPRDQQRLWNTRKRNRLSQDRRNKQKKQPRLQQKYEFKNIQSI